MKHSIKRILAILLTAALLCATLSEAFAEETACPGSQFTDMPPEGHWAHAAIDWALENGIVTGISATVLGPARNCTRAQMVTILWRAMGSPQPETESCPFSDVPEGVYYRNAVLWAAETGVTKGVGGGQFAPNRVLDRGQMVSFLYALAGNPAIEQGDCIFSDVPTDSYYHDPVCWAWEKGVTRGVSETSFAPKAPCTRAQAVTFLHRALQTQEEAELVEEADTRLVDLGWSQFVTVRFLEGGSLENTRLLVDGTDVTAAFTPITDDGSLVKWEITSLSPARLTAERDGLRQTVTLSGNGSPTAPELRFDTAPGYIIGHGPLAVWDYYLPNYDKAGQLRVEPAKTTFSLSGDPGTDAPAGWSPEAEIDEAGNGDDIIIMFNQRTQAEKNWFAAIEDRPGSLELVKFDESLTTLNSSLRFSLLWDVPHGSNPVNELLIPLGQTGLTSNGRYYVRIRSTGHDTALIPIHVVNALAPTLKLSGSGTVVPGQDLSFRIENMPYGIENPTYAAALTGPDGETKRLEMITDWYQIGDSLYLYNTVDNQGVDRNKLIYNGSYTLTVWSNGFKDMSCTFTVTGGQEWQPEPARMPKVDGVTSATYSGGGSGGGEGGGQKVSADLKFSGDLLINALLLDRLGVGQAAAKGIVDRWESGLAGWDSVSALDTTKGGFDWTDYINAVNDARNEGRYLCFADYAAANAAAEKETIPHAVKAVLEDNLLGDLQEDGSCIGARVPALQLVKLTQNADGTVDVVETDRVMEGERVCILTWDPEYFTQLSVVNLNGNSADLSGGTDYSVSVSRDDQGQVSAMLLTVTPQTQNLVLGQTNLLRLRASGYQAASFRFRYERDIETDLSVSTDKDSYARGESVVLTVNGSKGGTDFCSTLMELSIKLPDGTNRKAGPRGYYSSTEYYTVSGNQITIMDPNGSLFSQEGSCTVTLTAQYYNYLSSPVFTLTAPAEQPEEPEQPGELPEVASVEKVSDLLATYYRVHFTQADEALETWLNAITAVSVNGTAYSKTSTSFWMDSLKFKLSNDSAYGGAVCFLDLTADGFDEGGLNTVVVEAEGYEALSFTVGESGGEEPDPDPNPDPDPDPDPNPEDGKDFPTALPEVSYVDQYGSASYYEFSYGSYAPEAMDWIGAITGIAVEDTVYSQTDSYPYNADTYYLGSSMPLFMVNRSGLGGYPAVGTVSYTLTITAAGYKTAHMNVAVTNSGYAISAQVTGLN